MILSENKLDMLMFNLNLAHVLYRIFTCTKPNGSKQAWEPTSRCCYWLYVANAKLVTCSAANDEQIETKIKMTCIWLRFCVTSL